MGDRVTIDGGSKRGTLRFLGPTQFRPGVWAGVELDRPEGKHNGTYEGVTYFVCHPDHGLFLHPSKLAREENDRNGATVTFVRRDGGSERGGKVGEHGAASTVALATGIPAIADHPDSTVPLTTVMGTPHSRPVMPEQTPLVRSSPPRSQVSLPHAAAAGAPYAGHRGNNHGMATMLTPGSQMAYPTSDAVIRSGPIPQGGALSIPRADIYTSLPSMEVELEKRKHDVQTARARLDVLRLQLANSAEVGGEGAMLLSAIDTYDRALGKMERQVKRLVNVVKSKLITESESAGPEAEANTNVAVSKLEEELEQTKQTRDTLADQLHAQSAKVAELNRERQMLRKELAELRARISSIIEESNAKVDGAIERMEMLAEENRQLHRELETLSGGPNWEEERRRLIEEHERVLKKTAAEMEILNVEAKEAIEQFEVRLRAKDQEIAELRATGDLETVKRERDLAKQQVSTLQGKLLDYQDEAMMEAKHRAQIEALHVALEETKRRHEEEIALRDARIAELSDVSGTKVNEIEKSHPSSTTNMVTSIREENRSLRNTCAELQDKISEVMNAKQVQERYFTQQIAKLKKRLSSQLHHVVDATSIEQMSGSAGERSEASERARAGRVAQDGDDLLLPQSAMKHVSVDTSDNQSPPQQIVELREKIEAIISERDRILSEKDTELYGLQLRLKRATEEKASLQARYDGLAASSKASEVAILRKEIEHLTEERNTLKGALSGDRSRELSLTVSRLEAQISSMREQLDARTDELARLEANQRERLQTIKAQDDTIEHLRRELGSLRSARETSEDILRRQLEDTRSELRLREEQYQVLKRQTADRNELMVSLRVAQEECERLRREGSNEVVETLQRQIAELERTLIERQARINLLHTQLDRLLGQTVAPGAEAEAQQVLLRDLQEQLGEVRREKERLQTMIGEFQTDGTATDSILSRQLEELRSEKRELLRRLADANDYIEQIESGDASAEANVIPGSNSLKASRSTLAISPSGAAMPSAAEEVTELKERIADLSKQQQQLENSLQEERMQREEAQRAARHQSDMMDLAEAELKRLQEELAQYRELDGQRKNILVKYQALKDDLRLLEERLVVKEEEIKELQRGNMIRSSIVTSERASSVISPSAVDDALPSEDRLAALVEERDHLLRMNRSLEHEKRLLEEELQGVKDALKRLKEDNGLRQQHELLARAGHLIEELGEASAESSWSLLTPIKSVASFIRLYKPTEVNIDKLQREYEEILQTLQIAEGNIAVSRGDNRRGGFQLSAGDPMSLTVPGGGDEKATCGVCKRQGHTAAQCENMSDSQDPIHGGFILSDQYSPLSTDAKPYSA